MAGIWLEQVECGRNDVVVVLTGPWVRIRVSVRVRVGVGVAVGVGFGGWGWGWGFRHLVLIYFLL